MNTRISYGKQHGTRGNGCGRQQNAGAFIQNPASVEAAGAEEPQAARCCRPCDLRAEFCETITLHESFDASNISPGSIRIAYDTDFLGYTLEETCMEAKLPCGGSCPVDVMKVSLTGAIPYLISAGPVSSGCGSGACLSCQGTCMVDEVIGYLCGGEDPDLETLGCASVTPQVNIDVDRCECSDKTNVTFRGNFTFSNLPATLQS